LYFQRPTKKYQQIAKQVGKDFVYMCKIFLGGFLSKFLVKNREGTLS